MNPTLTFQVINGHGDLVKTISAKSLRSIYTQFKRIASRRPWMEPVQCTHEESYGCIYWKGPTSAFFLKEAEQVLNREA